MWGFLAGWAFVVGKTASCARAVPVALAVVVATYALVGVAVLLMLGADAVAASTAPLHDAVMAGGAPAVRRAPPGLGLA